MPATNTPARKKAPAAAARPRPRARRSTTPWRPRLPVLDQRQLDLLGLGLVALGVFLAFLLYADWEGGAGGRGVVDALAWLLGDVRFGVPVALVAAGLLAVLRPMLPAVRPFRAGGICLLSATTLALSAGTLGVAARHPDRMWVRAVFEDRGGIVGEAQYWATHALVADVGTHIIAIFLFLAGILLLTGASVAGVVRAAADTTQTVVVRRPRSEPAPEPEPEPEPTGRGKAKGKGRTMSPPEPQDVDVIISRGTTELDGAKRFADLFGGTPDAEPPADPPAFDDEPEPEPVAVAPLVAEEEDEPEDFDDLPLPSAAAPAHDDHDDAPTAVLPVGGTAPAEEHPEWRRPGANLLKRSSAENQRPDTAGQEATATRLIEALGHFGIEAKVVGTVAGPHITRYELRLAPGIKMSKVSQMKDDLAYALAATEIRILAPIPGKTAVGVEVPNLKRKIVTLGDVYDESPAGFSPLTVWLGKDVSGKAIPADLAKMPHLLVAGTTGAGKSGCINAMLASILLRATPEEVRLVLVDPKQVELNHYENVPHLLTPVITSPRSAANALQNLVREMEWRYGVMSVKKTRSLPELNKRRIADGDEPLPYILCVIDELADLMMVAPADVEDSIIRIAQKARAVGIHLVLATQSPRVDVITGMIKANVPSRIAFAVSSQTDSRVILDQNGAESLLGMGDMLFSAVGSSKLHRIQGAYIDEAQIAKLTEFWGRQGEPELREDLLEEVESEEPDKGGGDDGFDPDEDPLLGEAIELVVEMGTASTSMLQRRLRLGYTRAGRLMDMLERRGIISGYEGSKPRQVLVTAGDLPRVLAALAERGDVTAGEDPEIEVPEPPPLPVPEDILEDV